MAPYNPQCVSVPRPPTGFERWLDQHRFAVRTAIVVYALVDLVALGLAGPSRDTEHVPDRPVTR